jgi:hypothetical protein
MRRWKSNTRTTTGIVTTTDAAAIAVTGDWYCDAPVKNARAAGTVRERSVEVSAIALVPLHCECVVDALLDPAPEAAAFVP